MVSFKVPKEHSALIDQIVMRAGRISAEKGGTLDYLQDLIDAAEGVDFPGMY